MGHIIGLPDNAQAGDLMDITLGEGVRRVPSAADVTRAELGSTSATSTVATSASSPTPLDRREGDAVALPARSLVASPAPAAGPIVPLEAGNGKARRSSILDTSVTKATLDAALESLLAIDGENGDNQGLVVPGLVATPTPARVSAVGVIKTGKDRVPQFPSPSNRFVAQPPSVKTPRPAQPSPLGSEDPAK